MVLAVFCMPYVANTGTLGPGPSGGDLDGRPGMPEG